MQDWISILGLNTIANHGKSNAMRLTLFLNLAFTLFSYIECSGHRRQPHIILVVLRDLVSCIKSIKSQTFSLYGLTSASLMVYKLELHIRKIPLFNLVLTKRKRVEKMKKNSAAISLLFLVSFIVSFPSKLPYPIYHAA